MINKNRRNIFAERNLPSTEAGAHSSCFVMSQCSWRHTFSGVISPFCKSLYWGLGSTEAELLQLAGSLPLARSWRPNWIGPLGSPPLTSWSATHRGPSSAFVLLGNSFVFHVCNLFVHLSSVVMLDFRSPCVLFRRESDMPLTTLFLGSITDLESERYRVATSEKSRLIREENLALVSYVQSDCNTPSDRDHFVQMLQRHIKVDSFGACEHNKDLPRQYVFFALCLFLCKSCMRHSSETTRRKRRFVCCLWSVHGVLRTGATGPALMCGWCFAPCKEAAHTPL